MGEHLRIRVVQRGQQPRRPDSYLLRDVATEGGDWEERTIRGTTGAIRGLLHAEHAVYRTAESDDPARFSVSLPEDNMSRALQATSGRSFGIAAVLLQPRQTPSGAEIRAGASDAGHSSWIDQEAADAAEDLLFGNGLPRIMRNPAGVRLLCNFILC